MVRLPASVGLVIRGALLLPWTLISSAMSRLPDPLDNVYAHRQIGMLD